MTFFHVLGSESDYSALLAETLNSKIAASGRTPAKKQRQKHVISLADRYNKLLKCVIAETPHVTREFALTNVITNFTNLL